eukprot:2021414-Ditylum_brightwellii.AAC.1
MLSLEEPIRSVLGNEKRDVVVLSQTSSFQIGMSVALGFIALAQLVLLGCFIHHRSKRVLEFTQPLVMFIFVASGA